jgi:Flp pilus assembly protein TadG
MFRSPKSIFRCPRGQRGRRGGAVLETAIVLPVLLSLAFGTVEFGYYFFVKNTLQGAAREGARAAIISTATNTDVTTAVSGVMSAAGIASYTTSTTPATISGVASGTSITVTVTCTWSNVGLRPLGLIPANKTVVGTAVMRRE